MSPDYLRQALYSSELGLPALLLLGGAAFVLGAIHALGPGHGKSLMAAYLVGSKGRVRDALVLALTLTFSHVVSVLVIGLLVVWLANLFFPEQISRWLGLFSGIAIVVLGTWLLIRRLRDRGRWTLAGHVPSEHGSRRPAGALPEEGATRGQAVHTPHHGGVGASHSHEPHGSGSVWASAALGMSAGIIPCPKAIVIMLLAISLHKIVLGVAIILVFSLGIALTLVALGISVLRAGDLVTRRLGHRRAELLAPAGAVVIIALGVLLTIRTLSML